jgi:hypothetical protein
MKKLLIIIPITGVIAVIFGAMLEASIGTLESAYAQTNATNATNNTAGVESASEIENLTGDNTGLLQNSSDISNPSTGVTQGLEKEQTADTGGNMTAADTTAGQNATTAGQNATTAGQNATTAGQNATTAGQNATTAGGGANATSAANQTSGGNKTGNPLSNIPIIGGLFK